MDNIGILKIMKQSCYFAKACDREFNKKHIGVNLFSLQLCLHEYMLTIFVIKASNLFQDVGDYFLGILG